MLRMLKGRFDNCKIFKKKRATFPFWEKFWFDRVESWEEAEEGVM